LEDADTVWIKRDDCTGVTLSGNKARKLEFLLADALDKGCDTVITCGGVQTNHGRATAVAARQLGLHSHLLLRTDDPSAPLGLSGNLLLDRMVGATLQPISHADYMRRHQVMAGVADELRARGRTPYVMPEGGSNGLGTWGYIEAVRELADQLEDLGEEVDDIIVACGSGGTAAGVALGVRLSGLNAKVHAVNVCVDAPYFYTYVNKIFSELGAALRAEEVLDIMDGYVGLGYARNTTEELAYIRDVARQTGIILDPVYTGKAMCGLRSEFASHRDRFQGRRLLFIHTGGLFGLYDKLGEMGPVFEEDG
jgi:D-cysteine desulfhydrase family pyridoxal phosphate-dependent enzyme